MGDEDDGTRRIGSADASGHVVQAAHVLPVDLGAEAFKLCRQVACDPGHGCRPGRVRLPGEETIGHAP